MNEIKHLPTPAPLEGVAPNPKAVALLQEAKAMLWDGRGSRTHLERPRYICLALAEAASIGYTKERGDLCWELQHHIEASLGFAATYETWLTTEHGYRTAGLHPASLQDARLRWLDQLIADFELNAAHLSP